MSWNIDIKTSKDMTEANIDSVVAELPIRLKNKLGGAISGSKQSWGWSLAVDVHLRPNSPRSLCCSGSCGISGDIAEEFCKTFAGLLAKHLDCKVKVGKMSV